MEVPNCVVVLNGMAFVTILLRGNGLLNGTFTKHFIYIFSDIDMVIICINCIFWNQNVSNGHSVTMHNCNCIFINAPLVVYICKTECNKQMNLKLKC